MDPAAARVFGRPAGTLGAFAVQTGDTPATRISEDLSTAAAPSPDALAAAFSRPSGSVERLQRPPGRNGVHPEYGAAGEDHFWPQGAGRSPWRDPWAAAVLGPPAVAEHHRDPGDPPQRAARLSLQEALFGRQLSHRAIAVLGAMVLLIGGLGGF
ncbi:MAG TPA: serine protease, partial [Pseudonocardiaceae bacterium]|nr:serine protease [Pseudonocardiaceae bacterium]